VGEDRSSGRRAPRPGGPGPTPRPARSDPTPRPAGSGPGPRRVVVYSDGAARGNPGPAAAGAVILSPDDPDGRAPLATLSEYLGELTNNVAEYLALGRALDLARELGAREVEVRLDAQLLVEQLAGRYRVRDAKLRPLFDAVRQRLATFDAWEVAHVPREANRQADRLANEALDRLLRQGRSAGPVGR
jgi:ribonuclease HI